MKYDIPRLLSDNSIPLIHEGKNVSPGWVTMCCPFCGDNTNHLGYNLDAGYFSCWRCGGKTIRETVGSLLGISENMVYRLLTRYKRRPQRQEPEKLIDRPDNITLPYGTKELQIQHKNYLWQRQFNAEVLEERYLLRGTNHLGSYKFRIIAPIFHKGKLVSYIGRDITGKNGIRYKACPSEMEIRPHKNCLYGLDNVQGSTVVIVEGVSDVWRLGPGAVALFGLRASSEQIKLLQQFERRYIMLDSGEDESKKSKSLAATLEAFDGENIVVQLDEGDPGDMKQEEADILMKDLGFKN